MAKKINLDKEVEELFRKLEDYKTLVETLNKETQVKYKTNATFKCFESSFSYNLNVIPDIETLTYLLGTLISAKDYFDKASTLLGEDLTYKHGNHSFEDWVHDFKLRAKVIKQRDLSTKISQIESILNETLSPEQIRAMKIQRTKEMLNKLK